LVRGYRKTAFQPSTDETGTAQEPFDGTDDMQYISATLNKVRSRAMPAMKETRTIRDPLTNF